MHPAPHRSTLAAVTAMTAATTLTTALLSACGGGGDSGIGGGTVGQGTHSVPIQVSVPTSVFAAGSGERIGFDYLNHQRLNCGFGALRHNPILDTPGRQRAQYTLLNSQSPLYHPHTEVASLPGFTGVDGTARALAAGYKTNGNEVGEVGSFANITQSAVDFATYDQTQLVIQGVRGLMIAPYHAMAMVSAATEVGFGSASSEVRIPAGTISLGSITAYRPESIEFNWAQYVMLGFAMDGQGQLPPQGSGVRTYPCEGTTDVPPAFEGEWTDPTLGPGVTPGRNTNLSPLGTTIMVIGEVNQVLTLSSASVVHVGTDTAIPIYQIRTMANDPMPAYYRNNWTGYVMPDQPLLPNERYRVMVSGASGATPFTRDFTFTTGVQPVMR